MPIITGASCDKCNAALYWHSHLNKGLVVRALRKEGWAVTKKKGEDEITLCPKCRKISKKG